MVNLQSSCMIKIWEIFQIVASRLFSLTSLSKVVKAVDRTLKNGFVALSFFCFFFCAGTFWIYHNLPIYVCQWYGTKCSSFLKFFSVLVPSCTAPSEMNNYGFYPWLQILKTLLFAKLSKLFLLFLATCQTSSWWFLLYFSVHM